MPLHQDLFIESNPIPVKWAAYRLGLIKTPHFTFTTYCVKRKCASKSRRSIKIAGLI